MAIWSRRRASALIHHSDQGGQYTSLAFGWAMRAAGMVPSMGSVGDAYDNAMAESFFATLQTEVLDRRSWATRRQLRIALFDYVEAFCDPRRRHSALGYLSPTNYGR
jgi:putative transposase